MDALNNLMNLGKEALSWFQLLAPIASALAFAVGGFQYFFGGKNGGEKAKPFIIGGSVGLVLVLMASSISSFLSSKITF